MKTSLVEKHRPTGFTSQAYWQVWYEEWGDPKRPVSQKLFKTRQEAESFWYDSMPGRNDRACFVQVRRTV